jgi:glycosyltransferase involved in cell wall biosynthesis
MVKTKSSSMKILFLIDSLKAGGKERRLTELMKALNNTSDITFMLVVMDKEIHYKEILNLPIRIEYLIRKTKKDLSVFKKFYKICKDYKPDIVHCWNSMTAIYSVPACKFLKIKLVNGIVVDTPVQQNIFNISWLRAQLTFPFSDMIIGNSKAGLHAYKAPKYKSSLIYNGFNFNRLNTLIDRDIIKKELKINTRFVIGMVASFSKKKDYNTFFKAAELLLLKRDDVTFIAIGNDTDSSKATNSVDSHFTSNFRFLGKRSNIESYINAMDVCVLATFTEGISNSILEYMACGKPVIATMGGGTNEIVVDNYSG